MARTHAAAAAAWPGKLLRTGATDAQCSGATRVRVIFLDLDGVLNSRDYMENRRRIPRPTRDHVDAVTVPRLNAITDRTGAKIVISSTWRLQPRPYRYPGPVEELQRVLSAHGVTGEIIGTTPWFHNQYSDDPEDDTGVVAGKERGHEIQAWLDRNPGVSSFVILDDDSDMVHLAHRHIKTSFALGLLDEHVERAVVMLSE